MLVTIGTTVIDTAATAITMADWVAIGLAFGLALTVAIYALGPISGASTASFPHNNVVRSDVTEL